VQTGAVKDLSRHPLKLYFDLGLRVTINTDNRLVTDTNVSREMWLCHSRMGMGLGDIKSLVMAGFKSAFLPFHVKQGLLRQVSDDLQRFHEDGTIDTAPATPGPKQVLRSSKHPPVEAPV
jgi:adenosine deaminase